MLCTAKNMGPNAQKARLVRAISVVEALDGNALPDNEWPPVRQRKDASDLRGANATRLSIKLCHPVGFLIRQLQHLRLD